MTTYARAQDSTCEILADTSSGMRLVTMDDLRRDMFALIDATPNLDWLLLTKRPENIRHMWRGPFEDFAIGKAASFRENCWLIYSASDQASLKAGLPHLLKCRDLVPVIGLSLEPLIGPVDLHNAWPCGYYCDEAVGHVDHAVHKLGWVIVGGESGPHARPCQTDWVQSIVEQCLTAHVPVFVKQMGSHWAKANAAADGKGGDPGEWMDDLRVRQFPERGE